MGKRNKGITLVALVITIIILLILAGISIASLTGSGLFEKAKEAKQKYKNAQDLENSILDEYEKQINRLGDSSSSGDVVDSWTEELKKIVNVDETKTDPIAAIPDGTKEILEGDATKGIVIKDSKNNEWTWVEVPKTDVFKTATGANQYEAIEEDLINYVTTPINYRGDITYRDQWYALDEKTLVTASMSGLSEEQKQLNNGCGLTYYEYKENYERMLSSLYKYGGFWISKYEAGISGSDIDDSKARYSYVSITDESPDCVSQSNMIPYNYVKCKDAQILASKMSETSERISSLLFGLQWDLVCKYIDTREGSEISLSNSSSWGNYSYNSITLNRGKYNIEPNKLSSTWKIFSTDTSDYVIANQTVNASDKGVLLTTGASDQTNKMNICDFAGNLFEFTLERYAGSGVGSGDTMVCRGR